MAIADFLLQVARQFADWRVLLDILVFTVFIYLLYRTLRATGTWQIVLGLTIAAVGAGLASLIGLRGVEWIFSNFSQVALIAFLVIFQPEMRKFLERTTSLLRGQSRDDSAGLASLVEDVLFALAKRRWGGLIVIPGQDSLKQWISEGVLVDAVPSLSLLMSIFDPNSPGHDGAVLLEDGRIARIGVRLPLSETNSLPEVMGTRHHASQGIAEKTDALVLTVSEERGTILVFEKGRWTPVTEQGEAIARILAHGTVATTRDDEPSVRKGRRWRNAMEAGVCFVLACLFWVTVVMSKTQINDMIFTVPIQYSGLQNNLVLEGEVPQEVKLHVEGTTSTLTTLDLSLLKVQVDLSSVSEGGQTVALTEENVRGSKKVKVLEVIPAAIDLQVKGLEEAVLPVDPQILGQLPEGLEIKSVEVQPATLQVYVPKTKKKKNGAPSALQTTPIYLHGLKESTTVYCTIVVPTGIHTPDRRWPDIEVRLNIGPAAGKSKVKKPDA
ncbi:MAG: diadenylate cyclase [Desulfobulbaceae bacterium]